MQSDLHAILKKYFGYESFRGPQLEIIESVLAGKHTMVLAPTGMGKSLCYQLPSICYSESEKSQALTLVISPLIALMQDQVESLKRRGIDACYVNSSLGKVERLQRYEAIQNGEFSILYVTPERFRKPEFLESISARSITLLAVDEAHCISQWGHDFRPDYSRLAEIRELLRNPTTIALTATATPTVQDDIVDQLGLTQDEIWRFSEGIDRPNLSLEVKDVWDDDDKLAEIIKAESKLGSSGSGIVYFSLIRTLEKFSDYLIEKKIDHLFYHGDLPMSQRKKLQQEFMESERSLVLATNAFGVLESIKKIFDSFCMQKSLARWNLTTRKLVAPVETAKTHFVGCFTAKPIWKLRWNLFVGPFQTHFFIGEFLTFWRMTWSKLMRLELTGCVNDYTTEKSMTSDWRHRCACSNDMTQSLAFEMETKSKSPVHFLKSLLTKLAFRNASETLRRNFLLLCNMSNVKTIAELSCTTISAFQIQAPDNSKKIFQSSRVQMTQRR